MLINFFLFFCLQYLTKKNVICCCHSLSNKNIKYTNIVYWTLVWGNAWTDRQQTVVATMRQNNAAQKNLFLYFILLTQFIIFIILYWICFFFYSLRYFLILINSDIYWRISVNEIKAIRRRKIYPLLMGPNLNRTGQFQSN